MATIENIKEFLHEKYFLTDDLSCKDNENWKAFDFCNTFLQTQEELEEGTAAVVEALVASNVRYAEIRFCPTLHQNEGLTLDDTVAAVVQGFNRGDKLKGGIIICSLLQFKDEDYKKLMDLTRKWLGKGVVGFDSAGDETSFSLEAHEAVIRVKGSEVWASLGDSDDLARRGDGEPCQKYINCGSVRGQAYWPRDPAGQGRSFTEHDQRK